MQPENLYQPNQNPDPTPTSPAPPTNTPPNVIQPQTPTPPVSTPAPAPNFSQPQPQSTTTNYPPAGPEVPPPAYGQTPTNEGGKSYLAAFLFSLFLGILGVDRFYLGYIGTGVLKLLTFGGFGVWVLIDLIMILTNNKRAKDGTALRGYRENRKKAFIILIIVFLINLALTLYYVFVVASFFKALDKGLTITANSDGTTTTVVGTENEKKADNNTITPLGAIATAEDFSIKVTKVVPNPQTTGDQPDAGSQYLQVDISITNNSATDDFVPGSFFYRTPSGQESNEARVFGTDSPGKNVEVVGRQSMTAVTVEPGKTDDTRSLIFQIPIGDKGELVWRDGIFDKEGTKFGAFQLFE